ncbi:putative MFS family arabinose efflux permease [Motilibacter rhizosphaerae]|uniref:Putative MFS family arabinose efflux permease n=1 Tax=Motilibacter rhizosphaerae TaxID=598652 RepID=A0A4Q7NGN3_9ACTN|nr:MFS transporter [Motilibacter rhizosphaerae]RZS82979.1 putative MFS family arabinose efflux permease [Motilibacter rhizosphaerae]
MVLGTRYRQLLRTPGALGFSGAGILARAPMSMEGLAVVFLVHAATGSYAAAGLATGALSLGSAVGAPVLARLSDRRGQAWVLRRAPFWRTGCYALLLLAVHLGAPDPVLPVVAGLAGLGTAQPGALVRARWAHLLADQPSLLHTAFSLESALDELLFIVGPPLVTLVATQGSPTAGLLVPAAGLLTGALLLAAQGGTAPPPAPRERGVHHPRVLTGPLALLAGTYVLLGGVFGSVEVTTVAFAREQGSPGAAGGILAAYAVSSMLAGLAWGALPHTEDASRRFALVGLVFGVLTLGYPLASSTGGLAVLLCLSGFAISPLLVTGLALVDRVAAPGTRTEAMTWTTTGLIVGVSLSGALAGAVIDAAGAHRALLVCSACGLLAGLAAVLGARPLGEAARHPAARAGAAPGAPSVAG